jgi:hypothetical protein
MTPERALCVRVTYRWVASVDSTVKQWLALIAAVSAVVMLSACAGTTGASTSSVDESSAATTAVIPCDEVVGKQRSGTEAGYRVVLGIIAVPPARLRRVVPTKSGQWPFWRKAGLVLHPTRKTVSVSVPKPWRRRVAIVWGNGGPPVSAVKFQPCPSGTRWNGYAGGFYLRERHECVPLTFRAGNRSQTIRFGFNRSCSSA